MSKKKVDISEVIMVILAIILILTTIPLLINQNETVPASVNNSNNSWGLGYGANGQQPTGNSDKEYLKKYNAYYVGNPEDKVLYLTFDAGYENGYTSTLLDVLKKHSVPAAFFLVGHYLEENPDLVKRMVEEGHIVGNHTTKHPDMTQITSIEGFKKELEGIENLYKELIGEDMPKYYRPPAGKYNESNLKHAKELGYYTMFWSLAYVDWENNNQPSKELAFSKLLPRSHPGAMILLHSTSKTNAEILDDLLTKWKDDGYTFKSLDYFIENN
ncbi:peptidoglycan-N-acetylmuramic acid deacetylase [Natranaerovirga pectinivora]|uniref:Peptidoglycan-N-acetylmuramic acid deacetylase n=1 Tax=Natranaerovirga pectinivora TaxID=682400 RepID=A0A4V2V0C7_9FIRM|nr:delta-lactam-biosynthetic de-N-acetylase [Natranaerovirga pectinivora]TCT15380.1 peptidoglycan-N-acetylmuramic acid deacetylase [Natranaerovirga pectinivora]